jgi:hypothetical protein
MGVAVGGSGVDVGTAVAAGVHPATPTMIRLMNKNKDTVRFIVVLLLEQILTIKYVLITIEDISSNLIRLKNSLEPGQVAEF